jgi:hypothetical protein
MRSRKLTALSQSKVRSALTNGTAIIFGTCDHRTAWMRRLRDLVAEHTAQLGNDVTEAERRLIARAAMLTIQCEMLDAKFANEEGVACRTDIETYQRCSNTLRRLLESLGLQARRTRTIPNDPLDYARQAAE